MHHFIAKHFFGDTFILFSNLLYPSSSSLLVVSSLTKSQFAALTKIFSTFSANFSIWLQIIFLSSPFSRHFWWQCFILAMYQSQLSKDISFTMFKMLKLLTTVWYGYFTKERMLLYCGIDWCLTSWTTLYSDVSHFDWTSVSYMNGDLWYFCFRFDSYLKEVSSLRNNVKSFRVKRQVSSCFNCWRLEDKVASPRSFWVFLVGERSWSALLIFSVNIDLATFRFRISLGSMFYFYGLFFLWGWGSSFVKIFCNWSSSMLVCSSRLIKDSFV